MLIPQNRAILRAALILVAAIFSTACAIKDQVSNLFDSSDNGVQPAELVEFEPEVKIVERWSASLGGTDDHYLKLGPAIRDSFLYIAERDGDVAAYDLATGKQVWREDTDEIITGGPGAGGNHVVVGTKEGEILDLAADTGELMWRSRVSSEILAAPQVATEALTEAVVVRTGDGKLYALEANDGSRRWVYDREVPLLSLRGTGTPVVVGDVVYSGFDNGRLAALDLRNGKSTWELRVAIPTGRSDLERMVDIDSEISIDAGTLYAASYQGKVAAIDSTAGQIIWTRDISSHAGLAVSFSGVYVADEFGHVWGLEADSGISKWKQEALTARRLSPPAEFKGMVIVGDFEGYLHFMSAEDGRFIARERVSSDRILVAPIATDAGLLVYSSGGRFTMYDLADG